MIHTDTQKMKRTRLNNKNSINMRKKTLLAVIALMCLLVLTACDRKQRALDNLREFVESVEKNAPDFTDEEWKEANKEYDNLMVEIDKYDYSLEESKQIGELQGRLAAIKVKDTGKDAIEGARKAYAKWVGIIWGFLKELFGSNSNMPPFVYGTDSIGNIGIENVATDLKGAVEGITEGITDGNESQEEKP